ncbi:class I SAM-dependent methyltransferase [bacterium]|nr:class I SAM-dependent methyltransferase [bacterium]
MDKKTEKELLEVVKENYEQIAGQYNETRKKHLSLLWNKLSKLTKAVREGESVFDVGCGNGRLLDFFKNKRIDYLGIDSSRKLLEYARKNHPEFEFRQGNILNLGEIPEVNYDYVFSVAVFHHIPGLELRVKALRQLRNKVREGGSIIITVWNLWNKKKYRRFLCKFSLLKLIGKNTMDYGDIRYSWKNSAGEKISERYYHVFRSSELKRIARKAGFKKIKVSHDKFNYYLILKK